MTAIRLTNFGGIVPKTANRALPDNAARAAANCALNSGELRPMRKAKKIYELSLATAIKSIFKVDESTWFCWPTEFVDMVRSSIEGEARFCYTGDGVPKITTKALAAPVSTDGTPAAARALGIPSPFTAPGVSPSGGTGANVSRFYAYTFYSDWNEESAPSIISAFTTGKVDGTWSISGMEVSPPNSGSITGVSKTASTVTVTLGAANHYNRANDVVTFAGVVGMTDINGTWTIASATPTTVTINLTTAQIYTSGGTWARAVPWGSCKKRLYRTSSGYKADFQLVAIDITATTFSDTFLDTAIPGDSLVSDGWIPPPANMTGMVSLSNGVLAGFFENNVCFSEPYQPHAWPTGYRKKMASTIIGIASFDTNLGVATKGNPVVLSGSEPASMMPIVHREPYPCVSRASVCSVGDGIVFSTKNGLCKVNISDAGIFSTPLFGSEEWNDIGSTSLRCAYDGTKIYVYASSGTIYIMNVVDGGAMITATQSMDAVYVDAGTGDVYFSYLKRVYLFDSFTAAPMTMDWWSREFVVPQPLNMSAVKVDFDTAYYAKAQAAIASEQADVIASNAAKIVSVGGRASIGARAVNVGAVNASNLDQVPDGVVSVNFSFYAKENLVFSANMQNGVIARLPAGYKSDTFSIRIQSNTQVRSIVVADSAGGLRGA